MKIIKKLIIRKLALTKLTQTYQKTIWVQFGLRYRLKGGNNNNRVVERSETSGDTAVIATA